MKLVALAHSTIAITLASKSHSLHYGYSSDEDAEIQAMFQVDAGMSLYAAWQLMQDVKLDTLCVTG